MTGKFFGSDYWGSEYFAQGEDAPAGAMSCSITATGSLVGALDAVAAASGIGPGVKRRRGKTWQQAFWEAEAREAFEEIEAVAQALPERVLDRAEKLIEAVEAYSGPRISITDGIVREAQARQARRNAEALISLAREAERIMAARAAEQDDEEALLLLFA